MRKLIFALAILGTACGKKSEPDQPPPQRDPVPAPAVPADAARPDAAIVQVAAQADASAPAIDAATSTVVDGFELAPGEEIFIHDDGPTLPNPTEWHGIKLAVISVPNREPGHIGGKVRALVDGKSVDITSWDVTTKVRYWSKISVKPAGAVLLFSVGMDMNAERGSVEQGGHYSFVELVFDPKTKTIHAGRTWSGNQIERPPEWAHLHVKPPE